MSDTSWLPPGWTLSFGWHQHQIGDDPALIATNGVTTVIQSGAWTDGEPDLRGVHLSVCAQAWALQRASRAAELEPLQGVG